MLPVCSSVFWRLGRRTRLIAPTASAMTASPSSIHHSIELYPPSCRLGSALEPVYDRHEGWKHCCGDGAVSCFRQMIQIDIDWVLPIVKECGQIDCIGGIDQPEMTPPLPDDRLVEEHPAAGIAGVVIDPTTFIAGFEPLGRDHGLPEE